MIQWIKKSLEDQSGKASAARFTGLVCVAVLLWMTYADQILNYKINMEIFKYWFYLLVACLGYAGALVKVILALRGIVTDSDKIQEKEKTDISKAA
jgi:uncharacterized membrane protein